MKRFSFPSILLITLLIGLSLPSIPATASSYRPPAVATPTALSDTKSPSSDIASTEGAILDAFIQAPPGIVAQPYVILNAVELVPSATNIEIRGSIDDKNFVCESVPCSVPFPSSNRIKFAAYSSSGYISKEITASVIITLTDGGYNVTVSSLNQYTTFADSCKTVWQYSPYATTPLWAEFPQFPFELHTDRTLHHLATKLIISGAVDASSCPLGGLNNDLTWPTACGLEQAKSTMIEWQNQYDAYIWTASKDVGIPPKILKTLIQVESQYWPANQRFFVDEYGLGQVTQLGVDVLLRQDPVLFQAVCPTVLEHCNTFYSNLSPIHQAMVRGALLSSLDATCPTCETGFDITKAGQSIFYIARLLQSNCKQNKAILNTFGTFYETTYEDSWKFTLFSYHSGITCFYTAVEATKKANLPMTWENLSENTTCINGKTYVDGMWGNLVSFENHLHRPDELNTVLAEAVFEAPPAPTPLPTAIPSSASIHVRVLKVNDQGGDGTTQPLNNIPVVVKFESGVELWKLTVNGEVSFDLSGYPTGSSIVISLPGLYRQTEIDLSAQGVAEIEFLFSTPTLPEILP